MVEVVMKTNFNQRFLYFCVKWYNITMKSNTPHKFSIFFYLLKLPLHFLTIIILVATLFIPKQVYKQEEMKSLPLGYPIGFYIQDFSRYTPLEFPQEFSFGSPWEDPSTIHPVYFLLSYFIVYVILLFIYLITAKLVHFLRGYRTKINSDMDEDM